MKLSAPIYILKSKAKQRKREQGITMAQALDQIAKAEGFNSWSLLQRKAKTFLPQTKEELLKTLYPGDLLLIGARPGLGKTTLTLKLLLHAIKEHRPCFFFSLECSKPSLSQRLVELDKNFEKNASYLTLDLSDNISSEYIIHHTKDKAKPGSLIAVDYLQLLDQQRNKPSLQQQIEQLKTYAKDKGCIFIFISQIDRAFEQENRMEPNLADVRLPNPLTLNLFNKSFFLHNREFIS